MDNLAELVAFARRYHAGYAMCPEAVVRTLFDKYRDTTATQRGDDGQLTGFAVWQDWGDALNIAYVMSAVSLAGNLRDLIRQAPQLAAGRTVVYYDENHMKARILWQSSGRQLAQSPAARPES